MILIRWHKSWSINNKSKKQIYTADGHTQTLLCQCYYVVTRQTAASTLLLCHSVLLLLTSVSSLSRFITSLLRLYSIFSFWAFTLLKSRLYVRLACASASSFRRCWLYQKMKVPYFLTAYKLQAFLHIIIDLNLVK